MTLRVSLKDAVKASENEPGFFAERKIKKLRKEYEQLFSENMVQRPTVGSTMGDPKYDDDPAKEDGTQPSLIYFSNKFGMNNIAEVISFLRSISKEADEDILRIAHFFFHLGRRHERSIFK